MGKKYLLYIHDERFDTEPQKSGLVNVLLDAHYGKPVTTIRAKALEVSKELTEATIEATIITTPEQAVQAAKALPVLGKLCKNGHAIPNGRSKCMGKGCKYAN